LSERLGHGYDEHGLPTSVIGVICAGSLAAIWPPIETRARTDARKTLISIIAGAMPSPIGIVELG